MDVGRALRGRALVVGAAAGVLVAVGVIVVIVLVQSGGDEAGASEVQVLESGADGRNSVGQFDEGEAIARAEEAAEFSLAVPDTLPDNALELQDIIIQRSPISGDAVQVALNYTGPGETSSSAEMQLGITHFAPGQEVGFGGPPGAEEVDLGHGVVHIVTQEGGAEAKGYTVINDELPLTLSSTGLEQQDVLDMIDRMVGG